MSTPLERAIFCAGGVRVVLTRTRSLRPWRRWRAVAPGVITFGATARAAVHHCRRALVARTFLEQWHLDRQQ